MAFPNLTPQFITDYTELASKLRVPSEAPSEEIVALSKQLEESEIRCMRAQEELSAVRVSLAAAEQKTGSQLEQLSDNQQLLTDALNRLDAANTRNAELEATVREKELALSRSGGDNRTRTTTGQDVALSDMLADIEELNTLIRRKDVDLKESADNNNNLKNSINGFSHKNLELMAAIDKLQKKIDRLEGNA